MPANLTTKLGQLVDVLTPDTTNTRIGVANASPTRTLDVTGTFGASGASTLGGALTYGGITLSNAVTGTGSMVLSASPTLTGTLTAAAANFSGNLSLVNSGATASISIGSASNSFHQQINFLNSVSAVSGYIDYFPNSGLLTISPSVSTTFTGLVGIGMTPVNVLDITQTQDGASIIGFKNASTGTSGRVDLRLYNSSNLGILTLFGTGFTSANVLRSGGVLLQGDGSGGVTLNTGAAQPIYFGINSTEVARFDTSGLLLVGTTSSSGSISNTVPIIGGLLITNRGTVSVGNSATVTMFTIVNNQSSYLVHASINVGDATNYACAAWVLTDGTSTQVVQIRNGANGTSITASGAAIQFTNAGIGTQTVYWGVTRIGYG